MFKMILKMILKYGWIIILVIVLAIVYNYIKPLI